jgi:hypothetical protein
MHEDGWRRDGKKVRHVGFNNVLATSKFNLGLGIIFNHQA